MNWWNLESTGVGEFNYYVATLLGTAEPDVMPKASRF